MNTATRRQLRDAIARADRRRRARARRDVAAELAALRPSPTPRPHQ